MHTNYLTFNKSNSSKSHKSYIFAVSTHIMSKFCPPDTETAKSKYSFLLQHDQKDKISMYTNYKTLNLTN